MNLGERWTQRSRSKQTRTQRLRVQTWRPAECITTFFSKVSLPCVGGNLAWDLLNLKIKDLIIEYVEYDSLLVMESPWWGLKQLLLSVQLRGSAPTSPPSRRWLQGDQESTSEEPLQTEGGSHGTCLHPHPQPATSGDPASSLCPPQSQGGGLQSKWRLRNTFHPLPELAASPGNQFTNTVWFLRCLKKMFLIFPGI